MTAERATTGIARAAFTLDRSQLRLATGLRHAVGVSLPLLVGVASGDVGQGVALGGGALLAAFADIGGSYGARARTMMAAAAAGGL